MSPSALFIRRPVATTLLTLGIALAGMLAFRLLPVSPLPQVDFPTISVSAGLPGASPETMAATVATPLERALGRIAGVTEMTSTSSLGSTHITLQFDLSRNINGAARDVQAAMDAARSLLPTGLPSNPTYRKVNPADAPVMILSMTSDTLDQGQMYDSASTILAQALAQVDGVGQVDRRRQLPAGGARRTQSDGAQSLWHRLVRRPRGHCHDQRQPPEGHRSMVTPATGRSPPTTRRKRRRTTCRSSSPTATARRCV